MSGLAEQPLLLTCICEYLKHTFVNPSIAAIVNEMIIWYMMYNTAFPTCSQSIGLSTNWIDSANTPSPMPMIFKLYKINLPTTASASWVARSVHVEDVNMTWQHTNNHTACSYSTNLFIWVTEVEHSFEFFLKIEASAGADHPVSFVQDNKADAPEVHLKNVPTLISHNSKI